MIFNVNLNKIKIILHRFYPQILILICGLFLYGKYIFGFDIVYSVGAIARYDVWDFFLRHNGGWINFFKHRGEFIGGDPNYGMLNPIFYLIRFLGLQSIYSSEALLVFLYFTFGLSAMYYFLRKNGFARWSSLFGSGVYILNGFIMKSDQNTALGVSNFLFLPLLFVITQKGLKTIWQCLVFVLLCFVEFSFCLPSIMFWQLIFLFVFLVFQGDKKVLVRYLLLLVFVGAAMLPQFMLTASLFQHDIRSLFPLESTIVNSGLVLRDIIRMFLPFYSTSPQPYIGAMLYLSPIGIGLVSYAIFFVLNKWKTIPRITRFFVIIAIASFLAVLSISPFQFFLEKMPIINKLLARHPFRHVIFLFFSAGYLSAYALEKINESRARIKKFFIIGGQISVFISAIFIVSTLFFSFFSSSIYVKIENYYKINNLTDSEKTFPPEYYLNRIKNFYDFSIGNITLSSFRGIAVAAPYLVFGLWLTIYVFRKKDQENLSIKSFAVVSAFLPVLTLSAMLAQQEISAEEITPIQKSNNSVNSVILQDQDYRNKYVVAYGVGPGDTYRDDYYKGLYSKQNRVSAWLKQNQFLKASINSDSAPNIIGALDPFSSLALSQLDTFSGCLERSTCRAKEAKYEGQDILKTLCPSEKDNKTDFCKINLEKRLNFFANSGVGYIISQDEYNIKDLIFVEKFVFNQESDIIKDEYPKLNLYRLKKPGGIVMVPKKIKYERMSDYDILDYEKVKKTFEELSAEEVLLIERNSNNISDNLQTDVVEQKIESDFSNIQFAKNSISFDFQGNQKTQIVINVNYYDGWLAKVDGVSTDVDRANYNFLSIMVPQGKHHVTFEFSVLRMVKKYLYNSVSDKIGYSILKK